MPDPLAPTRWDIFCRLVDNMGDIGVCWRLARRLAARSDHRVRLWIDQVEALSRLCPHALLDDGRGIVDGIEVRRWEVDFPSDVEVADVVIEAFACDPPPSYLAAMARRDCKPVWINLEYLSAEDWTGELHCMGSPHPRLPLHKVFFFPGFMPSTGGLLREPGLFDARDRFRADPAGVIAFLRRIGCESAEDRVACDLSGAIATRDPASLPGGEVATLPLRVSLFAYEQPGLEHLLGHWAGSPRRVHLIVPEGRVLADVARGLGVPMLAVGDRHQRGNLSVVVAPFVSQHDYDRLLWACDLNFVRGEDSFVRAQWAASPFVWQIYRQQDDAHRVKLEAFLARYLDGVPDDVAVALRGFWWAWNGHACPAAVWDDFAHVLPQLAAHARDWATRLAQSPDLADVLVNFYEVTVK